MSLRRIIMQEKYDLHRGMENINVKISGDIGVACKGENS